VPDIDFDNVPIVIEQPSAWSRLLTYWLIVAPDDCKACHCRISLLFHPMRDRHRRWSFAAGAADDAVLAQNAVRNVFKLCHNSDPRVVAPLNEIYLAIHCALPLSEFILRALYMQAFRHLHLIENKLDPWATTLHLRQSDERSASPHGPLDGMVTKLPETKTGSTVEG